MPKPVTNKIILYLLLLFAGIIWGVTFSLARIATEAGHHPLGLTFWQAAGGGTILLIFCVLARQRSPWSFSLLLQMGVVGLCGSVIPGALLFYAAPHVPAGVLAITIALVPILTYAASWLLSIDAFSIKRLLGIVVGFAAILLVMLPESSLPDPSAQWWLVLALIATVFYTIENLYVELRVPESTNVSVLLTGGMFIASMILLPFVLALDVFVQLSLPIDTAEASILSMMLVSSVAYLIYLYLIRQAGAVFASMSGYVITLSGVFWGMLIFNEKHSAFIWLALLLMLLGMFLVSPRQR